MVRRKQNFLSLKLLASEGKETPSMNQTKSSEQDQLQIRIAINLLVEWKFQINVKRVKSAGRESRR